MYYDFFVLLIIPDVVVKNHIKFMMNTLMKKMGFKGIMIHQEAVLASYALAI